MAEPHRAVTAAATDIGRRRSGNEDHYAVWSPEGDGGNADTLLVVCDGMGGSNAGEVASRMVVDAVVREFAHSTEADPLDSLANAVEEANREVYEHSLTRHDLEGMGTTCVVALMRGEQVFIAHVGDSRVYLVRDGQARQLTTDHSLVAQLVAAKQLDPEAAQTDRRRNVVTRSVGVGPTVIVDRIQLDQPLGPGDTLLLCSDGLHGVVSDEDIGRVSSQPELEQACHDLIALANDHGGPDNITVVMGRRTSEEHVAGRSPRHTRRAEAEAEANGSRRRTLLIAGLIGLGIALAVIAWLAMGRSGPRTG